MEDLTHLGITLVYVTSHPDFLRALSRKDPCQFGAGCLVLPVNNRRKDSHTSLASERRRANRDYFTSVVVTTVGTNVMRETGRTALRAPRQLFWCHTNVLTSLALSGLGIFFLWQWWHVFAHSR